MITTGYDLVQVMQLKKGGVNLTTGTFNVGRVIHCVADGSISVAWGDSTTDTINMLAGQDYGIKNLDVTITSGTFHVD